MVTPTSRMAYTDCFDLLDRALDDDKGTRVKIGDKGDAWHMRLRLNAARTVERDESKRVYQKGDPGYGVTPWDVLVVKIKEIEKDWWVYIEKRAVPEVVESLSEIGEQNG